MHSVTHFNYVALDDVFQVWKLHNNAFQSLGNPQQTLQQIQCNINIAFYSEMLQDL